MNRDGWGKVVVSQNGKETNSTEIQGKTDPEVMAEEIPYWDPFQELPPIPTFNPEDYDGC